MASEPVRPKRLAVSVSRAIRRTTLAAGWDSTAATYTAVPRPRRSSESLGPVESLDCRLSDGHAEADATDCYGCHGDDYVPDGNNVHNPGVGAAPDHMSPTSASCFGAGCHDASKDLAAVHSLYVGPASERPQFATTCELCHDNPAVDISAAADMRCTPACHGATVHTGYSAGHAVTSASDECVACHGSDISTVHGAAVPGAECATCHDNVWNWTKDAECASCHNGTDVGTHVYTPADPNHYDETTHTATPFSTVFQGAGPDGLVAAGGQDCSACHSATLKAAHATTSTSGGR